MSKLSDICTIEYLKECFVYDPIDGELWWRKDRPLEHFKSYAGYRSWKTKYSKKKVGSISKNKHTSYKLVNIKGLMTSVHQIAYAIYHGYFVDMIDHIDGDGLNNRIDNLRESNHKHNAKNRKVHSNNTSGVNGITWCKTRHKWLVTNRVECLGEVVVVYEGYYANLFEACCVRISWMNRNGYTIR